MATYYIDSINGNNSNSGLTELLPKKDIPWINPTTIPSNTTLLLKGSQEYIISNHLYINGSNIVVGTYGAGNATVKNTNVTKGQVIHVLNSNNVEIRDLIIDGLALGHNGILVQCSNSNIYNDIWIHHNEIYNCNEPNPAEIADANTRAGVYYSTLYTPITKYLVENNYIHDCYGAGIHNVGTVDGAIFRKNILSNNCKEQGAHNFSGHPHRLVATSGWTLVSGTTYSRGLTNNDVFVVNCGYPDGTYLAKNTTTPTTPGINEFGWSSGVLYINFATNPNTIQTGITYSEFKNFIIEYNESYGAINWLPYPYDEGHGIALDDWAGPGIIRCNYTHDNQGLGISCNKGFGNQIYGNIIANNALGGITAWHDTKIRNNTFYQNGIADIATSRQIWMVKKLGISLNNQSELSYNIIYCKNNQAYLVSAINQVCKNNLLYNYFSTNAWGGLVTTGVITNNPLLDANFVPQATQAYGYGEKWWGLNPRPSGYNGEPLPDIGIDIGAIQTSNNIFHPKNID
jgi:hypothetical protein